MSQRQRKLSCFTRAALGLMLLAAPLAAQGPGKRYAVTNDRAVAVTRDVLVKQGYDVVRIEVVGTSQVVYYRRGKMGKGKGKGRLEKMIIRRDASRIVFVDTPPAILLAIDIRLRL